MGRLCQTVVNGFFTVSLSLEHTELIRAVRSSDTNLNELLKMPQNQLESNFINQALLAAVHSGSSSNVFFVERQILKKLWEKARGYKSML